MKNFMYRRRDSLFIMVAAFAILASITFTHSAHAAPPIPHGENAMFPASLVGLVVGTKGLVASNGTDVQPAIVTRDWRQPGVQRETAGVNLTVIPDAGHHVIPHTSVTLYETESAGDAATAKNDFVANGETIKARPRFAYLLPAADRETQTITAADVGDLGTLLVQIDGDGKRTVAGA